MHLSLYQTSPCDMDTQVHRCIREGEATFTDVTGSRARRAERGELRIEPSPTNDPRGGVFPEK